ncbi:MAG: abortive infection family protein [Planctomycetes bacterium]|nr:abortive infection family protein [Planctomycetota bacterium]
MSIPTQEAVDKPFSIPVITALLEVIVDGATNAEEQAIGTYRSGAKLEMFLGAAGIEMHLGAGTSRLPGARNSVINANRTPAGRKNIKRLFEQAADPREYRNDEERHTRTVEYLNEQLRPDELEIRPLGRQWKLLPASTAGNVTAQLEEALESLDFDSVKADFDRALAQADTDPAMANASACSSVESVCKCLLDEMGKAYPKNQDIKHLCAAVSKELDLTPGRPDLDQDVRQILGGLTSVTGGIGALRTHEGAHGKGKGIRRIDSRIARLAINAASTIVLFFIETWQKRRK